MLGALPGIGAGHFGKNEREFLPVVPTGDVPAPDASLQYLAQLSEQRITALMAIRVVEPLEVVEVEHDDPDRVPIARGASHLPLQRLFHVAPIEQPRQRVANRLAAQRLM